MVAIRVVSYDHQTIGDFINVNRAPKVTDTGALIITGSLLVAGQPARIIYNPTWWAYVEESPDDMPPPTQVTDDELSRITDALTDDDALAALGSDLREPRPLSAFGGFSADVHEAMKIICRCDDLRCPVVLNPATPEEKEAFRLRQRGKPATVPEQVDPLKRCSWEVDHLGGHEWQPDGWPYGPAEHHPMCPRHPSRYNRPDVPVGEGQPLAAGVTPGAAGLSLADTNLLPVRPAFHLTARENWGYCAAYHPSDTDLYCQGVPGHDGPHETTPGGDRQTW
jgi:hypothetical protein